MDPGAPPPPAAAYTDRLAAIHRALGIPADYGRARRLEPFPEADEAELVQIAVNPDGRAVSLAPLASLAWLRMRAAAVEDKVSLVAISGFRSVARQTQIIEGKLAAGQSLADILRCVAAPGYSEHHTARAIDIGSPEHIELDEDFARTDAFRWLERRASAFGFQMSFPRGNPHGIVYEPWHWCWRP